MFVSGENLPAYNWIPTFNIHSYIHDRHSIGHNTNIRQPQTPDENPYNTTGRPSTFERRQLRFSPRGCVKRNEIIFSNAYGMSSCETNQVLRRVKVKSVDRTKKGMLASRARADTERVLVVRTPLACTSQQVLGRRADCHRIRLILFFRW